jgi:hypothetical protein
VSLPSLISDYILPAWGKKWNQGTFLGEDYPICCLLEPQFRPQYRGNLFIICKLLKISLITTFNDNQFLEVKMDLQTNMRYVEFDKQFCAWKEFYCHAIFIKANKKSRNFKK